MLSNGAGRFVGLLWPCNYMNIHGFAYVVSSTIFRTRNADCVFARYQQRLTPPPIPTDDRVFSGC